MYKDAIDALEKLLTEEGFEEGECRISGMHNEMKRLTNGVKYFAVEVTCRSGVQYGISAYDEEAERLFSWVQKKTSPLIIA